jgi:hypothetical protein
VAYYMVASTGAKTFESKGIRPGRRHATDKRVPDGLLHAYELVSQSLACGADPAGLNLFKDRPWLSGLSLPRCSGCLAKVPVKSPRAWPLGLDGTTTWDPT